MNNIKIIKSGIARLLALILIIPSVSSANYVLGDGLLLGDVFLSGYSKLEWNAPVGGQKSVVLDDLSIFASASVNKYLNPFIEAEIATAELWNENDNIGYRHSKYVLERLYNDVLINEQVTLRIGKSLAPVGEWNRIHAAPLVWTSNRPITTRYSFSESVSGIRIRYIQQNNNLFQFYYQPGNEWVKKPLSRNNPRHYENVSGVSFDQYFSLNTKLGFAAQHATVKKTKDRQWVYSIDAQWQNKQLSMEFQTSYADINLTMPNVMKEHEWGGYLQGVWHFNERWHAILRPEYFNSRLNQSQSSMLYGVVYQPQAALSIKLEYIDTNRQQSFGLEQGLFSSLALLF